MNDRAHASERGRRTASIAVAVIALVAVGVALAWPRDAPPPSQPATRFADIPRIDVHVHVPPPLAERAVRLFREHGGVRIALNASGGAPNGGGLEESAEAAARTSGALLPYCSLDYARVTDPDFEHYVRTSLDACRAQGAVGLKVYKGLGLGITVEDGALLAVDDPRLDVLFDRAGELGLPVLIHSGDPQAFFEPPGEHNERHAELEAHPSWSFYGERENGEPWPTWREVFEQFERRVARHPRTQFLGAHFGNAPEEPETVARMLDEYPNFFVETGARIPEIGRHPADRMRAMFVRYADRILFGTDFQLGARGTYVLGSSGRDADPEERIPFFYRSHFRWFETADRDFAHPTPIQGDWTIDGIDLPREVLEQIYWRNASRLFHLPSLEPDPEPEPDAGRAR